MATGIWKKDTIQKIEEEVFRKAYNAPKDIIRQLMMNILGNN